MTTRHSEERLLGLLVFGTSILFVISEGEKKTPQNNPNILSPAPFLNVHLENIFPPPALRGSKQ